MHPTLVEGVQVIRIAEPTPRTPMVYPPNIVVVGQGRKRAYLGDEIYVYDPFNYLVLSVPLPAECEADASPEEPVLLAAINVEPAMLGELILELDEPLPPVGPAPRGISTTPMWIFSLVIYWLRSRAESRDGIKWYRKRRRLLSRRDSYSVTKKQTQYSTLTKGSCKSYQICPRESMGLSGVKTSHATERTKL